MFCLGGDCHTATIVPNTDMGNVGYLAMLNEMKKICRQIRFQYLRGMPAVAAK
ncbi:type-1V conjugative transfer system mating pair stabilization family protein [Rickettsia hoogstraalii str. RCCE3]|nr:type-1V conjugative transfer system mating pair stabilization family protein [Rickettsia hoogstraalii str. RCCE3]